MRVLVVEDDPLLAEGLALGLGQSGYAVDCVADSEHAQHALDVEQFDLMILDLGLPGRGGLDLLGDLRRAGCGIPTLILTARDGISDRVGGLDAGADDYMSKPFDLGELSARVRALIRRSKGSPAALLSVGALTLDPADRQVALDGTPVALSPKEFALLHSLALSPGKVLSRAALLESAYSWGEAIESNALEVHIHNLRKKLGPACIQTVRGVGYRLLDCRGD